MAQSFTLSLAVVVAVGAALVVPRSGILDAQGKSKSLPGPDSSNFYTHDQVTRENVDQLEVAWFYPYAAPTFAPVYAHDVLYGLGRNASALVALDAATGKELWVHEGLSGITSKGINYWESADGKDRPADRSPSTATSRQIDARTGKSILTFGNNGIVDHARRPARARARACARTLGQPRAASGATS